MTQYGRYILERRLAVGGMAEIMAARLPGPSAFSKRVVIKRLLAHHKEDAEAVAMFLDEARLAARFGHANLVQVYELAEIEGTYCIVMELIDGRDLGDILTVCAERGLRIPPAIAALVVSRAAEALHYVHQLRDDDGRPLQIVHADVSPTNIVVTRQGEVKVVDFGIAKHVDTGESSVVRGKLGYMPPEQLRGGVLDARTDVYALGVVFYELLTTRPLLSRMSQEQVLQTYGSRIDFTEKLAKADIPEPLRAIAHRMLAREPADRVTSAADVHRALESWLSTHERPLNDEVAAFVRDAMGERTVVDARVPTAIASARQVPAPRERVDRRVLGGAIAAVVALVVVGAFMMRTEDRIEIQTPEVLPQTVPSRQPERAAEPEPAQEPVPEPTLPALAAEPAEPVVRKSRRPVKSAPVVTAPTPVADRLGRVTFHVDPWAQVYADGKLLGTTPMAPVTMTAGTHTFDLTCPDTHRSKRVKVTVAADSTTRINETLR